MWLGIVLAVLAQVPPPPTQPLEFAAGPVDLGFGGYWKARGTYGHNLFLGQADANDLPQTGVAPAPGRLRGLDQTGFLEHGLRLSPTIAYRKIGKLQIDADVLTGVMWGDNDGLAKVPFFGGNPSSSDRFGNQVSSLAISRVWLELNIPVGVVRIGRMPSQWGMGLLANSGDGLGRDFGEARYGSTVDRILFATRPLQVVDTLLGAANPKSNLIVALGYDLVVDDAREADAVDPERDCQSCPPQIVFARPGDDVQQLVGVVLYKNDKADLVTPDDSLTAGAYVVYRSQRDTRSDVVIIDAYAQVRLGPVGFEGELIGMTGTSSAIDGENPKKVGLVGGAARLTYLLRDFDLQAEVEVGHAPGDDEPTDRDFHGYPLHPDHNVGLLLYEEVLAARTARAFGRDGRGLWSRGGVYNSTYVNPRLRWKPLDGLSLLLGYLWARAAADTGAVWAENSPGSGSDLDLGHEIDLALRYDFGGKFHVKLEGGVLIPGQALWRDVSPEVHDLRITSADRAKVAMTVQSRLGFEW